MKYLIKYWDKYQNLKTTTINATSAKRAEEKFYKNNIAVLVLDIYKYTDLKY